MSVDTYLKGKMLSRYSRVDHGDLQLLIEPKLLQWARRVELDASKFLFWRKFDVLVEHNHGPT